MKKGGKHTSVNPVFYSINGVKYQAKTSYNTGDYKKLADILQPHLNDFDLAKTDHLEILEKMLTLVFLNNLLPELLSVILQNYDGSDVAESDIMTAIQACTDFFLTRLHIITIISQDYQKLAASLKPKSTG